MLDNVSDNNTGQTYNRRSATRRRWVGWLGIVGALCATGCAADSDESWLGTTEQALSFTPNLPWPSGITFYVSQGQNGSWSHSGNLAYALDFSGAGCGGTHVLAVGDGTVTYAYDDCADVSPDCNYGWGNAIVVDHGSGDFSKYTHLRFGSIPGLSPGDDVCRGDHLGNIGTSGNSTGDHLHFQFQNGGLLSSPSVQFEGFAETNGVPAEDADVTSQNVEGAGCGAQPTTCEVTIDLGTTIVDDQTNCFHRAGTSTYWWQESFGHDGHHWFTFTTNDPQPDCTATWDADVVTSADYLVEAYVPDNPDALTEQVRYEVRHDGTSETLTVDQAAHRGQWVALGTFGFAAGGDQRVRIFDDTGEAYVNNDGPRLLCDAIRYTSTDAGGGGVGTGGSGTGASAGAGASGTGGYGDAGSGATGAELPNGGAGALGVGLPPSDEDADCSCRVPGHAGSADGGWRALALAALFARRRARRRR